MLHETAPLRALSERVILGPLDEPDVGGLVLILPEAHKVFRIGRVCSVGPEAARLVPDLREGMRVLYSQAVSAKNVMRARHVAHHSAIVCEVAEGVSLRDIDPLWKGEGQLAIASAGRSMRA